MTSERHPKDSYIRTDFLERLAHELRGPAGVTLGVLDHIERRAGSPDEKLGAQLAMARRGVARVVRIADRLERTAQLERGEASFAFVACDLRGIVESAAHTAEALDPRKNVRVSIAAADAPCIASIDASWVLRAVGEIIGNAIRFARSNVSIETRVHDLEVQITVHDDGPGFSSLPRFERFGPSMSRGGLGLSLPLAHDVLVAHGGRLELSPPAMPAVEGGVHGATVRLMLPLLPPAERSFAVVR